MTAGVVTIDLGAIVSNWRRLKAESHGALCAAVVKADAYGLGLSPVASALAAAGCGQFFVASIEEAKALRQTIGQQHTVYVFNGYVDDDPNFWLQTNTIPVINSLDQLRRWQYLGIDAPCALMVDTGMSRLGLSIDEARRVLDSADCCANLTLLLSHFACADEPEHPSNARQSARFHQLLSEIRQRIPDIQASMANTAGLYLGASACLDLVRPGIGLYGVSPNPGRPLTLSSVVSLQLPILQLRRLTATATVGYGATCQMPAGSLLATVYGGYADGLMRSLSGRTCGHVNGIKVPMIGRVSMDYCVFDVTATDLDEKVGKVHGMVELLGPNQTVDELAISADTIGYEILTALGGRYRREYING